MRNLLFSFLFALAAACGTTTATPSPVNAIDCTPGESASCTCRNGTSGAQLCDDDGTYGTCACDGSTPTDGGKVTPDGGASAAGGPTFLSFGTNVKSITEGASVTFTTVVSHPQGTDALAGGSLISLDGAIQYGPFSTGGAQKGAYSLTLSWYEISKSKTIEFTKEENRVFVAEFFDAEGRRSTKTVSIKLHCNGEGACSGSCIDLQNDNENCGKCGRQCADGECGDGKCVSIKESATRAACTTVCSTGGGKCDATACTVVGIAGYYSSATWLKEQQLQTCAETPAASIVSHGETIPFSSVSCCCVMP